MHALVRRGAGLGDDRLLRLMRQWLRLHDAIAALLPGLLEHVRQVWVIQLTLAKRVMRDA